MDYPKFAVIIWMIATVIIAILSKKAMFKTFGIPQNKYLKADWRAYLICCALLAAFVAIGLTAIVKAMA